MHKLHCSLGQKERKLSYSHGFIEFHLPSVALSVLFPYEIIFIKPLNLFKPNSVRLLLVLGFELTKIFEAFASSI